MVKSLQIRNGARPERSHKVPRLDPSVAPSPLAAAPPLALLERGRIPGVARRAPAPRAFPYRVRARQSPLPFTRRPQLHGVPPPRVGDAARTRPRRRPRWRRRGVRSGPRAGLARARGRRGAHPRARAWRKARSERGGIGPMPVTVGTPSLCHSKLTQPSR